MLSGEFRTPNRADVSCEADAFSALLDVERVHLDFDDFMERTQQEQIPSDLAALALKHCNGDFRQAYAELHPGSDPSVTMWHANSAPLVGLGQQDTFTL